MLNVLLLVLQAATLGVLVYVIFQIKNIFREVRTPVVRQKGQLSADFKDRLRNLPRPDGAARENRENRDARPDRGPRPEGDRGPRSDRGDRPDRGPRPEGDRGPRSDRGDRPDRGPRPEGDRPERAPRSEASAPVAESAPVASEPRAAAPAPAFSGRRPLNAVAGAASSESSVDSTPEGLSPSSLAQPVSSDAPIRHGRRTLPKVKPRFDDEGDDSSEDKKEAASA